MAGAFFLLALCAVSFASPARKCTPCQPGFGMVEPCYDGVDTVCKPCKEGTYSPNHPHHKACLSCSSCGKGLYVERKCTKTSNTFCDGCHTYKGKLTDDFLRSCILENRNQLTFKELDERLADFPSVPMGPGPAIDVFDDKAEKSASEEQQLLWGMPGAGDLSVPLSESGPFLDRGDYENEEPMEIDFSDIDIDEDPHHKFKEWDGTSYVTHAPINLYPAKDGHYPANVSAALAQQRRKLWLLIIIAAVVFVLTVTLLSLMLYFRCRLQGRTLDKAAYLQDHLREHDLLLIQDCAARLQRPSPERKIKQVPEVGVYAFENPLEQLLDEPERT